MPYGEASWNPLMFRARVMHLYINRTLCHSGGLSVSRSDGRPYCIPSRCVCRCRFGKPGIEGLSGTWCMPFGPIIYQHIGFALFADRLIDEADCRLPHIGKRPHQLVVGVIGFDRIVVLLITRSEKPEQGERRGKFAVELFVLLLHRRHGMEIVVDMTHAMRLQNGPIVRT